MLIPSGPTAGITLRERADVELLRQKTYLDELFELAPDAVVLTTLRDARILRVNREFTRMFGYTSEEAVGSGLRNLVMPDGLEPILPEDPDLLAGRKVEWEIIRRRKDGTLFHAHITGKRIPLSDDEDAAYLIFRDVGERKQAEALFAGEKRLLEMIARGAPLSTTLDALCRLAEDVDRDSLTSILLLDRQAKQLRHGAGPSLAPSYVGAVDGAPVGLGIGPCAAAAHLGEQVISLDFAGDERWSAEIRGLASAHGLRTCWSTPIKSPEGRVLGTFAIFPSEPTNPTPEQSSRIEQLTHLASIAIERAQSIEALHESEQRYERAMVAAEAGFWDWNVPADEFYVSTKLLEMTDFPPGAELAGRSDFLARAPFHPDDRTKWERAVQDLFTSGGTRLAMEMRSIHGGEMRWALLSGMCTRSSDGKILRWAGSATDVTARKRAEEALRLSEERYALAMEASEEGHFDWNVRTDEIFASEHLKRVLDLPADAEHLTRGELMEAHIPFHPDDSARIEEMTREVLAGDALHHEFEYRLLRGEAAELRWIQTRWKISRDEQGVAQRVIGVVRDVTKRKRAEHELRESESRFRALTALWSDWYWRQDEHLRFTYSTAAVDPPDGYPGGSAIGKTRWELPGIVPVSTSWAEHRALLAAHKPFREFEYSRPGRDGTLRYVSTSGTPIFDEKGEFHGYHGVARNITERKRVEEELRSRQEMLEVAQKAARAAAFEWRVGAAEDENRWSPDIEAMHGIAVGAYDGTYESWKKLVHPEDWPNVLAAIQAAQQTGDVDAEYRVIHPGGVIRWLHAKARLFFDAERKPTRVVGFMLDVTDRHRGADELLRMERQLRQAQRLEALGTLAGGIAHDFNNLLGAILGYGEMALRRVRAGSRLRRDIENIMIAGERGRALVDRILAFSRSGIGEWIAVHVEDVVRETLALFAAKVPRHFVVERRLRAEGAAVMGDPTQIHQVLMNLLTNAVQAMPSGGTLHVSVDRIHLQGPRVMTMGSIVAREYVTMEVADSGTGIPPEIFERMFDPFFTTKEVGVGTGLGLSLVEGIVVGLGGAIDVATTLGKGSVFKVYLPVADEVAVPSKPGKRTERRTQQPFGRGRVMVIDDEDALVRLAVETLTQLGYSAVGFTSSAKAIDVFLAAPGQFDAVITDESMPGASGSKLIHRMRAIRPTLPILLVSGYLSGAVIERAREAGATEVLKKPLLARQLQTALERVLPSTSTASVNDAGSPKR